MCRIDRYHRIYWIDPLAYGFSAVLANEFKGTVIPCVGINLVPNGLGYADAMYQACTGVGGALPGATSVTGEQYLGSLSYSADNIWRNFGIVWALWVLFVGLTIYSTTNWEASGGKSGFLLIPREKAKKNRHNLINDEEAQVVARKPVDEQPANSSSTSTSDETKVDDQLIRNTSVFTWKNLTYTVKTSVGDRVLLDDVQGWVKPGMLGALMGSSGAGKTTYVFNHTALSLYILVAVPC